MHNHLTVNPGFAGMKGNWSASGIYRKQWQKMQEGPETYAVNIDAPFKIKGQNNGIGINLMNDHLGMQTNMLLMLNYAFQYRLNWGILSMGIKLGVINTAFKGEFYIPEMSGSVQPNEDPALSGTNIELSKTKFDAGVGVFLTGEQFYSGLSVSHLLKPSFKIGQTGEFFWNRHLTFTAGYAMHLSPVMDVQPSFTFNTDFISNQYNVNTNLIFKQQYWGGISYRDKSSLSLMGGIELKNGLMLGYSYDLNTSNVGKYLGGSQEVTFSYTFGLSIGKKDKLYKSIRFL